LQDAYSTTSEPEVREGRHERCTSAYYEVVLTCRGEEAPAFLDTSGVEAESRGAAGSLGSRDTMLPPPPTLRELCASTTRVDAADTPDVGTTTTKDVKSGQMRTSFTFTAASVMRSARQHFPVFAVEMIIQNTVSLAVRVGSQTLPR